MHRTARLILPALLVGLALGAVVTVGACGTPSIEARVQQYNKAKDRLDALGTKMPHLKMDIQRKLAEFQKDFEAAKAKGGEAGSKAIAAVISRMDAYEKQIAPAPAKPAAGTASGKVGSKLGGAAGAKPMVKPAGKLGGAAAKPMVKPGMKPMMKPGMKPMVKPGMKPMVKPAVKPMVKPAGKLGGAAAPAPTAKPAAGGSGFGAAKPAAKPAAPAPKPVAPAAKPATGGSGFGGK